MPSSFHKKADYVKKVTLLPFYWGFDLGMNISTDEMYKMLNVIDAACRRARQDRPELQADRRRAVGGVPEEGAGIDLQAWCRSIPASPNS